ncbi:MAG: 2-oxo acid dehydrogenase subunit E2 [Chitinophagales bacterium]|nr:2-oxo acid dehydrogenase subunit E2 [Chitinophagales bacterium]
MAEVLRLPRMSDTMEEGIIAEVNIKPGDNLSAGDVIAEVETDKATMEWESFQEGTVLHVEAKKGDAIPVDGLFAILGEKGEDFKHLLESEASAPKSEAEPDAPAAVEEKPVANVAASTPVEAKQEQVQAQPQVASTSSQNGRIKASPLAKKMAADNDIQIDRLQGSGDDGRIIKRDIEKALKEGVPSISAPAASAYVGQESYTEEPVSQMRKTIARRLAESKFGAPHFYLTIEMNMDITMESRKRMNEIAPTKISFNDIIVKAVAAALKKHPKVNSSWLGDKIRYNDHVNIGVAVAVDEGLLVPVIRFADGKSLSQISEETGVLAEKARNKKLQPDEMSGNTFTISNLGMFGIEEFTAIINPPDSCILAVGGIKQVPVIKDGELKNTNVMKVTLSCDHRVVDGATGAHFLQTLKGMLEDPIAMLI